MLADVSRLAADPSKSSHERYLAVFKLLQQQDEELALTFNDLRRSTALVQLARIRSQQLLTEEEFAHFSPETRAVVQRYLDLCRRDAPNRVDSAPTNAIITLETDSYELQIEEPMPTHEKARELADAFEAAYPEDLPRRLEWWCCTLGIDRLRFLRMMGMSGKEAKEKKSHEWETILQEQTWKDRGWWVEGKLHELLSLFDYDWKALSHRLHHPQLQAEGDESTLANRPEEVTPNGNRMDLLLNLMVERGPESLSALLAYLASSANGIARQP